MKVGLGIRDNHRTDPRYLKFAHQIGVSHAIVFMPDDRIFTSAKYGGWSVDDLTRLQMLYNDNGLTVEGFENFDPKIWYKILLDEDDKQKQMDYIKRCIENMGKAGIKIMGYNFSIGCVTGLQSGPFSRGGAQTVQYVGDKAPIYDSLPLGYAWNTQVIDNPPEGKLPFISIEEMLQRRNWFLEQIIPVAEESGVQMAAHPEDPPVPILKNAGRILTSPEAYEDMFNTFPSTSNCVEFCQGTFTEMGVDVYKSIKSFGERNKISYVHFRNVIGTVPNYIESFIDEGDIDMVKALTAYRDCGFTGLLMPDHTPSMSCDNPNETGMAYAIGYIRGVMKSLNIETIY